MEVNSSLSPKHIGLPIAMTPLAVRGFANLLNPHHPTWIRDSLKNSGWTNFRKFVIACMRSGEYHLCRKHQAACVRGSSPPKRRYGSEVQRPLSREFAPQICSTNDKLHRSMPPKRRNLLENAAVRCLRKVWTNPSGTTSRITCQYHAVIRGNDQFGCIFLKTALRIEPRRKGISHRPPIASVPNEVAPATIRPDPLKTSEKECPRTARCLVTFLFRCRTFQRFAGAYQS